MKKKYIAIGLLASSLVSFGQRSDSTYRKRRLATTDVQIVMSFYTQDNNHSAVTGGIGTENLQVYATQFSVDHQPDSANIFHFDGGVDVISSASTDNIDFIKSSASKVDLRTHANLGYSRRLNKNGSSAGINSGISIESDYTSLGVGLSYQHVNLSQSREISLVVQTYFDDLRWGRLHNGEPIKLIYPAELRNKEWFDHYKRTSYNIEFGLYQVVNQRMALGIYPGIAYQSGLLSTPFHRVYFNDDTKRVENLPESRLKFPVGVQLNTFLGGRWILRTYYRFYRDDFGIVANTFNAEASLKISPIFTLSTVFRWYTQTAADYFHPYKAHDISQAFYTSDYDLSAFQSFKPGIGFRYAPFSRKLQRTFNALEMRYAFYARTDGLHAHMVTLYINYTKEKKIKNSGKLFDEETTFNNKH